MNAEILLRHFDRISNVPDAVPRLRQFVLDLAVRGKLAEQNPNDEPARELIQRIEAERNHSQARGSLTPIAPNEIPFSLPDTWRWIRLGEAFQYDCGIKREPKDLVPERWLLELEDIEKDTSVVLKRLTVRDRDSRSAKSEFRAGDILYGKLRPYLNKVVVASEPGYSTTEVVAIRPYVSLSPGYCSIALRRPDFVEYVNRLGRGTKMPRLRTPDAVVAPFPLPPFGEQHRIAATVDRLMALCDRLEDAQEEREARRDRLTRASLHPLNNGAAWDELREHSRFFINSLPRLTVRADQIKQLRNTILNLAVCGRLIGHIHGDKSAMEPTIQFKSFDITKLSGPTNSLSLPAHWSVEPLDNIALAIVDCPHSTPKWTTEGRICVRTNQFHPGYLDLSDVRFVSEATYLERIQRLEPTANDILYSREGGILGVACRVPPEAKLCLGQRMMLIRAGAPTDATFLEMVLNSPLITRIAFEETTGGAAPRVNVATVKAYPIPVPPVDEQRRIMAKVNELMSICDRLDEQLTHIAAQSHNLLNAILREALHSESQSAPENGLEYQSEGHESGAASP